MNSHGIAEESSTLLLGPGILCDGVENHANIMWVKLMAIKIYEIGVNIYTYVPLLWLWN